MFWVILAVLVLLFLFLADPVRFLKRFFIWSLIGLSFLTPFWPAVLLGWWLLQKLEKFFD